MFVPSVATAESDPLNNENVRMRMILLEFNLLIILKKNSILLSTFFSKKITLPKDAIVSH